MTERTTPLLMVGPFPPPVHGFAVITEALACKLEKLRPVIRLNAASNAPNKTVRHLSQAWRCLVGSVKIVRLATRGAQDISIGANSQLGLLYTLWIVCAARVAGYSIKLHHHSYAYITKRSTLMYLVCIAGGRSTEHVFLASSMRDSFEAHYPPFAPAHILSNAPFVPVRSLRVTPPGKIVVGLLSNLSPEKGLTDFLATARLLHSVGLPVEMVLAGPAEGAADIEAIRAAVDAGIVSWLGPLYGESKDRFFQSIDLFLFPTRYKHEAQPTVIFEAFANGVPVIAYDRGSVREQVGACLRVVDQGDNFADVTLVECQRLLQCDESQWKDIHRIAQERHVSQIESADAVIKDLYG